ncbi:hypothetical protein Agub_g14872 [Astrephomene gubernaculifera]|uniref:Protein kinase domain-containing protein n=1 Tax=Astrephomene gubernaculifera TaxID=47775 RepID=A0AAD3E4B7_9CHLO|nr:hypothetical protein Agub_g14872 [Astrephomene gubernaculifera]
MGSCLSACAEGGSDQQRRASAAHRKRSRNASITSYCVRSRLNSIAGSGPVPDFGIGSLYRVMELLGEGGTGQTWLCQDLRTAQRVAIKFIARPLAQVLIPMVTQEIQLQAQLSEGHLGLVRMESALLSRTHLGLVMEYVDGGTLTQYVTRRGATRSERGGLNLDEYEARYFFKQLISAVEYLHKNQVAHRDLKMCNVVMTQRRPPTLKICDFGFAKSWDEDSVMHTRLGTPVYMSPQLINSKKEGQAYRATAADVWACGVMLFAMLLGRFPYDHAGHPDPNSDGAHVEVLAEQMQVVEGEWAKSPRLAPYVALLSEQCRDFLAKLLDADEARRINIPSIREHPWFKAALPPHLEEALKEAEGHQARLDSVMKTAKEEQLKRRNDAVHDLIVLAGQEYNPRCNSANSQRATPAGVKVIFECTDEAATEPSSGGKGDTSTKCPANDKTPVPKLQLPLTPMITNNKSSIPDASGVASGGGSDREVDGEGDSQQCDAEVVVVDLSAVAQRTKSGGVKPMNHSDDEDTADSGLQCDSDDTGAEAVGQKAACRKGLGRTCSHADVQIAFVGQLEGCTDALGAAVSGPKAEFPEAAPRENSVIYRCTAEVPVAAVETSGEASESSDKSFESSDAEDAVDEVSAAANKASKAAAEASEAADDEEEDAAEASKAADDEEEDAAEASEATCSAEEAAYEPAVAAFEAPVAAYEAPVDAYEAPAAAYEAE